MTNAYLKNLLKDIKEMRIALIATYPEMKRILTELVADTPIKLNCIHAQFETAATIAQSLEDDIDVILTRGGTGHFIKNAVSSIPVIIIPISPFDLSASVSKLPPETKRIGLLNYGRPIFGTDQIEMWYQKKIHQYLFFDHETLKQAVADADRDCCQVVFGGSSGCMYANKTGMQGIEIVSGYESIYQALLSAVDVFLAKTEERKQAVRLEAAFNSLNEGIALNDEHGNFTLFNSTARHLFHLDQDAAARENITTLPMGEHCLNAFHSQSEEQNYLQKLYEKTINISHFPVQIGNEFIGQVSTFQDVTKIQYLEGKIRKQLGNRGFQARYTFDDIIAANKDMKNIKKRAELFAQTDFAILIEGESGVGKELFAHSIHNASPRQAGPFVAVNCAAIPEQLLESELFGYASGAFTGARKDGKQGLFEMAHNGTIFLDEIGEIPKYIQVRLLRVLQEKEVMRVGDDKIITVNCRVISATNKNLSDLIKKGEFRQDLFYRLNILSIFVPPLRYRKEDILVLAEHFFKNVNLPSYDIKKVMPLIESMNTYGWPGNARELNNICLRIAALTGRDSLSDETLLTDSVGIMIHQNPDTITLNINSALSLKEALSEAENQYILAILEQTKNNQTLAAKRLGIGRTTLWRRICENDREST